MPSAQNSGLCKRRTTAGQLSELPWHRVICDYQDASSDDQSDQSPLVPNQGCAVVVRHTAIQTDMTGLSSVVLCGVLAPTDLQNAWRMHLRCLYLLYFKLGRHMWLFYVRMQHHITFTLETAFWNAVRLPVHSQPSHTWSMLVTLQSVPSFFSLLM